MHTGIDNSLVRSVVAPYVIICAALALLLGLSVWGAYEDSRYLHTILLRSEVAQLQADAQRTVGRIERDLERHTDRQALRSAEFGPWLREHWDRSIVNKTSMYAAIVDNDGTVLAHSHPSRTGLQLERNWDQQSVPEAGDGVALVDSRALTGSGEAYDVRVPIRRNNREVGAYHRGFGRDWFAELARSERKLFLRQRAITVSGVLLIVLFAGATLMYLARHANRMRLAIQLSQAERANTIAQLAAGLAHEIRNPLHAIRLNLHALARVDSEHRLKLSPTDHQRLLNESNREIERVEKLMQELVHFASPDQPRNEIIDIVSEVQSVLDFISQELMRRDIRVKRQFPEGEVFVRFDRGRFRQLLLNLVQNAEHAIRGTGTIQLAISLGSEHAVIDVADDGPGIPRQAWERVFDPFYTTKSNGSGLGLALVRRFVNEAGGMIVCQDNLPRGTRFHIELPVSPISERRMQPS